MTGNPLRWAPFWWLLCVLTAAVPTGSAYLNGVGVDLERFTCVTAEGVAGAPSPLVWLGMAWVAVLLPGAPAMTPGVALWRSFMARRMGRVVEPLAIGVLVGIAVLDVVVRGYGGQDACGPMRFDWAAGLLGWGPVYLAAAVMAGVAVRLRPAWEAEIERRRRIREMPLRRSLGIYRRGC